MQWWRYGREKCAFVGTTVQRRPNVLWKQTDGPRPCTSQWSQQTEGASPMHQPVVTTNRRNLAHAPASGHNKPKEPRPCTSQWSQQTPKEAFALSMQLWRQRCEKCVRLQGDYVEKWLHFQLPRVSIFLNKLGDFRTWIYQVYIYIYIYIYSPCKA